MSQFSWFGWLTKGHLDVSLLDRLTAIVEVCGLIVLYLVVCYVHFLWKRRKR